MACINLNAKDKDAPSAKNQNICSNNIIMQFQDKKKRTLCKINGKLIKASYLTNDDGRSTSIDLAIDLPRKSAEIVRQTIGIHQNSLFQILYELDNGVTFSNPVSKGNKILFKYSSKTTKIEGSLWFRTWISPNNCEELLDVFRKIPGVFVYEWTVPLSS